MADRGIQIKADTNKAGWEEADFPISCETCLGDNPYVRMTKEPAGKACKICERPFCNFRWKPGTKARYKSTQVCQTCAKMKNVCQVCILDLQYGLPVEVRDRVLAEGNDAEDGMPKSDTNLQWMVQKQMQLQVAGSNPFETDAPNQKLLRIARNAPYYKRNLPHKCSFYAKGECNRGDKCPFLHEMPTDRTDPLAHQNVKDRFYGKDDPVAQKLIGRMSSTQPLFPPSDINITTLWIGGLTPEIGENDLRDNLYRYGEIVNVRIISDKGMAFVEYATRASAEFAADSIYHSLCIKNIPLRVNWASKKEIEPTEGESIEDGQDKTYTTYTLPPPPGLPPGAKLPELPQLQGYLPPSAPPGSQLEGYFPPSAPPGSQLEGYFPTSTPSGPQVYQQQLFGPPGSMPPGLLYPMVPVPPFIPPIPPNMGISEGGKLVYPSMDPNRLGAAPKIRIQEGDKKIGT